MRKLLFLLAILIPALVSAQHTVKSLTGSNNVFIGFYEFKPADYNSNTNKYPLIIFLHGLGERGNGTTEIALVKKNGVPKLIDQGNPMKFTFNGKTESFLVLSPQLSKSYGSWPPFYVEEMINYAVKNLRVDANRIVLTGLSLGGGGTWAYPVASATNASKLAAIAPVCGTCTMSNAPNIVNANLPVWAFHASNDGTVGVGCTNTAIDKINALNPTTKAKKTIYPDGGHAIWGRAYDPNYGYQNPSIYEWFLMQNKTLAPNRLPSASGGSNVTISTSVGTVSLRGTASDPDGSIVRTAWRKIAGPAYGTLSGATTANLSITGLNIAGEYKYEFTAVDNRAGWDRDTITVTVSSTLSGTANTVPDANAGADVNITLPTNSANLNGSASKDADGTIKTYAWTKLSGGAATLSNTSSATATVSGLVAGTYSFRLAVTDDKGATATDDVIVNVASSTSSSTTNTAPVAKAGTDLTVTLPTNSGTLNASGSTDADGRITKYSWRKVSGNYVNIVSPSSTSTTISGLTAGTYVFELAVTDDKGAVAKDQVSVVVKSSTTTSGSTTTTVAPVAKAGADQTISLPASSTTLSAAGSYDSDGSVAAYEWSKISGPTSFKIVSPTSYSTSVSGLVAGTYVFRLKVTDNAGNRGYDDVKVIVK